VLRRLEGMLSERFRIGHTTIQVEAECCPANGCSIGPGNGARPG
jgi:hypothetical protein